MKDGGHNKSRELAFITDRVREFGGMKRLGCIFHTPKQAYFYDSGTGKVECLNEGEERFFTWLFNRKDTDGYEQWCESNTGTGDNDVLAGIKEAILQEHLLQAPYPSRMKSHKHQEGLREALKDNVRMITLELTGRCNLRCGYCIYNEGFTENRNFSDQDMSEETARKAIKYLADNSSKDASVTFYGGEPLLRFELIKSCVAYSRELMKDKNLSFSITSNMTLMTREMAEYFYGIDNFCLVASLDGPEEIHDAYRKYPGGKGSFQDAIRGLKILTEVFGDSFTSRVSISMVFAPPYTYERIDRINRFYEELEWLPKETDKLLSYPEHNSVAYSLEESDGVSWEEAQDKGYVDTLYQWTEQSFKNKVQDQKGVVTKKFQNDILLKIHKRPLTNKPAELEGLNGSCIPGIRRLYVTANGEFKVCERVGNSPSIGNVSQGLLYDVIKQYYVEDYIRESEKDCSDCWAKRICGICYAKTYSENGIDGEKKRFQCDMARHTAKEGLILYHTQLEQDADSIAYLNEVEYG